ncbi:MAG: phosphotransacetylase family protein [Candidatus Deferrimicrobiaceae bacterium]
MKLYIASTSGYSGKTLLALALSRIWMAGGVSVGYVKPLGKIPVVAGERVVDGDALFLAKELGLPGSLEDVCPVVITQDLAMAAYRREPLMLREQVTRAVENAAALADVLLLGGAANLRDGYFFGLSPIDIITSMDCRVLLIDRFAGEKSMDQVLWAAGVLGRRLLGVVLNRVVPSEETFVRDVVRPYFEAEGIRVFGVLPVDPVMHSVSAAALVEGLSAAVASGEDRMDTMIERFCVGAMDVEGALRVFRRIPRKAVVTGGMRADIQYAALETDTRCLVLTGGVTPNEGVRHRAQMMGVPVLVVKEDTMATVERFEQLLGRVRIREKVKTDRGVDLVVKHVDIGSILASLRESGGGGE